MNMNNMPEELRELLGEIEPLLKDVTSKLETHREAQVQAKAAVKQLESLTSGMWDGHSPIKNPMGNVDKVIADNIDATTFGLAVGYIGHYYDDKFNGVRRRHLLRHLASRKQRRHTADTQDMFKNAGFSLLMLRYKRDLLAKYEIDERVTKQTTGKTKGDK